jgi:hypothetical protein
MLLSSVISRVGSALTGVPGSVLLGGAGPGEAVGVGAGLDDVAAASLLEYIGHPAYGPGALRADLDRFVFLLGGSDGEDLFGQH